MIEFGCPHCGKRLVLPESFAGRDGWCRYCKGIIKMPQPGHQPHEPELPLAQKYARLERMFRFATDVVDEHRQLQNKLHTENGAWAEENRIRVQAQLEVDRLNNVLTAVEADRDTAKQNLERLTAEAGAFRDTIVGLEQVRDELADKLADTESELLQAVEENDRLLERVLEAEQSIESLNESSMAAHEDWTAERDASEKRLTALRDELSAAEDESASLKSELDAVAQSERRLRDDSEAAVRTALEKQRELELALAASRAERDESLVESESKLDQVQEHYAELQRQFSDLERSAAESRDRAARQLAEATAQAGRVPDLEGALAASNAKVTEAEHRIETLQEQMDNLERAAAAAHHAAAEHLAEATSQADRVAELEAALTGYRSRLDESEDRCAALRQQIDGLERSAEVTEKRRADALASWETQRRELAAQLETLREARRESDAEILAVRSKARETAADHEETIERIQTELANETRLRAQSEAAATAARRDAASASMVRDEVATQMRRLQEQLAKVTADYEALLRSEPAQQPVHDEPDARIAELERALAEANAERARIEAKFVGSENRAALSESDQVGYRSQFSSMAREFFEREVARQTGSHAEGNEDGLSADREGTASILDAVEKMRQ